MTADGPGSRELVAARDRSGGRGDGSEARSSRAYSGDPVVIALRAALREIGAILATERAERRRNLSVVRSEEG